jgi:hypothetical protein
MIKSRSMRWAGHVAEPYTGYWWRNLRDRDHLEDPGVDRKVILRWISRKCFVWILTGSKWLRIETGGGYL